MIPILGCPVFPVHSETASNTIRPSICTNGRRLLIQLRLVQEQREWPSIAREFVSYVLVPSMTHKTNACTAHTASGSMGIARLLATGQ